jgi:hypothetical protein
MSKKKKNKKNKAAQVARNLQRKLALSQGFYDGRFKEKTVSDRKKEERKKKARGKVDVAKEDGV